MDSLITAAARALNAGDALGALKHIALREDAAALALRGIAMAQLGDCARARELLRRAQRGFGSRETLARARCQLAEAEVALALRDLSIAPRSLQAIADVLQQHGDTLNAMQARLLGVRRLLLLGRVADAEHALHALDGEPVPAVLATIAAMARAELAMRALRIADAEAALAIAAQTAARAGIAALSAEVAQLASQLQRTAARSWQAGVQSELQLAQVETLLDSGHWIVDACRRGVRVGERWRSLARRPVLFALLRELALAWPGDVDRNELIARVFRTRHGDDSHRARLRVEMGRLRTLLQGLGGIQSTAAGYALHTDAQQPVVVLAPPFEGDQAALLALLADGQAWSSSALAQALGSSQRAVQRALVELQTAGQVQALGRARAQRWLMPSPTGFTTLLLLPATLAPE